MKHKEVTYSWKCQRCGKNVWTKDCKPTLVLVKARAKEKQW